ncbi:MAG: cell division protein FtsZ [Verrucomicrobiae bacterium]|nr:cell division protein FtsZ [Verrucomicrobiae bacterium]
MNFKKETDPNALPERKIRIKVFGVGGGGTNTIDRLLLAGLLGENAEAKDLEVFAVNTDAQALAGSVVPNKINIGRELTKGYGAGGNPEVGEQAALEDREALGQALDGADIVFIAACLGGGTGTGASPVIANLAKERGALTLAFVTLPFQFELERRREIANVGLTELKSCADAVICVPNDKLFHLVDEKTSFLDAFKQADDLLGQGVCGIWRVLTKTGMINLDFADVKAVLQGRHGDSVFGFAEAQGEDKARDATRLMLESPLMKDCTLLSEADSVLVSIVGGPDLTLAEVHRAMEQISKLASSDAHVIMGAAIEEDFSGKMAIMIVAATHGEASPARCVHAEMAKIAEGGLVAVPRAQPAGDKHKALDRWKKKQHTKLDPNTLAHVEPSNQALVPKAPTLKQKQATFDLGAQDRGRFDRVEPTIVDGEDMDQPTYLRKGIRIA